MNNDNIKYFVFLFLCYGDLFMVILEVVTKWLDSMK